MSYQEPKCPLCRDSGRLETGIPLTYRRCTCEAGTGRRVARAGVTCTALVEAERRMIEANALANYTRTLCATWHGTKQAQIDAQKAKAEYEAALAVASTTQEEARK